MSSIKKDKSKIVFKGRILEAIKIGVKSPKKYNIGDLFETENEKVYQHFLTNKKIEKWQA